MKKAKLEAKQAKSQDEINQECDYCEKITCTKACFNRHVGSMIALSKLLQALERENGTKTYVAGG